MLWIEYVVFGMILIGGFVFTRASEILFVALLVAFVAAWFFDRRPSRGVATNADPVTRNPRLTGLSRGVSC